MRPMFTVGARFNSYIVNHMNVSTFLTIPIWGAISIFGERMKTVPSAE